MSLAVDIKAERINIVPDWYLKIGWKVEHEKTEEVN